MARCICATGYDCICISQKGINSLIISSNIFRNDFKKRKTVSHIFELGAIMKKYNLIFLKSDKMLLSRKQYSDWREIQNEYDDYMASLEFESLLDVQNYIRTDYKLTLDKAKQEVNKINETPGETVEVEI